MAESSNQPRVGETESVEDEFAPASPFMSVLNTPTATELSNYRMHEELAELRTRMAALTLRLDESETKQSEMEKQLHDKQGIIDFQKDKLCSRKHPGKRERTLAKARSGSPAESGTSNTSCEDQRREEERRAEEVRREEQQCQEQERQEAEAQRLAEEQRREEQRHAEDMRREEQLRQERERQEAEAQRLAEEQQREEQRRAEEMRREEQQRQEQERQEAEAGRRAAEEQRQAAEAQRRAREQQRRAQRRQAEEQQQAEEAQRHLEQQRQRTERRQANRNLIQRGEDLDDYAKRTMHFGDVHQDPDHGLVFRSTHKPGIRGEAWVGEDTYKSRAGHVHDTTKPAPGYCFNCGPGHHHWRRDCPRAR